MWNKLRNEPVNKTGYIKRIIAYGIDWYLGSVLSSLPLILLYMSLSNMFHQLVNVLTGYNIASIWNKVGLVITILSGILVIVLKSKKSLHDIVSHTLVVDIKSEDYKNMLLSIEKKNKKQNKKMKKRFA